MLSVHKMYHLVKEVMVIGVIDQDKLYGEIPANKGILIKLIIMQDSTII